jgi:glycosyltransferase involved in cell wall biosynthesis
VIPVFKEEDNLEVLYERLTKVMVSLNEPYEIIVVDDGSKDKSFQILQGLHKNDSKVKVIRFTRNFGQHMAITAGLDNSKGENVIIMDADLQDPPEEIPKLIVKQKEGYDIVYGYRRIRQDSLFKRITSKVYLWLLAKLTRQTVNPDITPLRIISRKVVDYMSQLRERSRFYGGLVSWLGFPFATVDIKHSERYRGKTKYNLRKMLALATEGIISFSDLPLRLITYFGLTVSVVSFITGIVILIRQLIWDFQVAGYTSTIVSLFFLGGILLLVLGVIGQYIGRIHIEVKKRPLYVVRDKLE